jgi:two-component system cell cycle sensor histidine kinase/response regulator CckA
MSISGDSQEQPVTSRTPPCGSLELLLDSLPAVVWTTDADLVLSSITGAGLESLGADPNRYLGGPVGGLFPQNGDRAALPAHELALQGQVCRFELEMMGHALRAQVGPLCGPAGEIVGTVGVAVDNTDRRVAEDALKLSEQSYRLLIEEAPYAICRTTISGQVLQVNRGMVKMLAYDSETELLLKNLRADVFAQPRDYDQFAANLRAADSCQSFESAWRCQDGTRVVVSIGGRSVRDQSGKNSYLEILAENITQRKQLEEELRQAQKMQAVGQLAAGVAHDFNNLLTVIKGQVDMALADLWPNDPLRAHLGEVERAADRASTLTRQLLAFGRLQVLQKKVLNLNDVVSGMTDLLRRLIGEHIQLTFIPGAGLGVVHADAGQVEQVLMNLVLNAKHAMPDGGNLTISTRSVLLDARSPILGMTEPGEYVTLTVVDSGHGMSTTTAARIFEPFFTTKDPGEGTGLGLFTVYGIVKQNGGYIQVDSEPGKGARFTVHLPKAAGIAEQSTPAPLPGVHGGTETILLAEDEEGVRMLMQSFLVKMGYRVLAAADGAEARQIAGTYDGNIDIVITDLVMPNLGGRQLAAGLRQTFPHLKVIFMSGYAGDELAGQSITEPNTMFLEKPFPSMGYVADRVRQFLDQSSVASA